VSGLYSNYLNRIGKGNKRKATRATGSAAGKAGAAPNAALKLAISKALALWRQEAIKSRERRGLAFQRPLFLGITVSELAAKRPTWLISWVAPPPKVFLYRPNPEDCALLLIVLCTIERLAFIPFSFDLSCSQQLL
jgi:hypothetical protein